MLRLRALIALASVSASLLLLGAAPAAGPTVAGGPATLFDDEGGQPIAVLPAGTPLIVNTVSCEKHMLWVDVTAGDALGWLPIGQVSLGDGVPIAPRAWAKQPPVYDSLNGSAIAALRDDVPALAHELACPKGWAWLRISQSGVWGWLPAQLVEFPPAQRAAAVGPPAALGTPSVTATPSPHLTGSPEYGMNVFFDDSAGAATSVALVRDLRFGWVKTLVRWRDVEAERGVYDWSGSDALVQAAGAAGLHVLARVDFQPTWARSQPVDNGPPDDYQDYANFVAALISHYQSRSPYGHVDAVEVWNEPNLDKTWGEQPVNRRQAADYVRLLSAAYGAVKGVDPSVSVISASLSVTGTNTSKARGDDLYLQWMYEAGLRGHFDGLGAHAPGFKAPPEASAEEVAIDPVLGGHRSFTFRRIEDLRAVMVANGDADKQVWITEFGWSTDPIHPDYNWFQVSEAEKADYLVRAFTWARLHWSPWVGPMFVWTMSDPTWGPDDEKYWWAIDEPDGTPRQAYLALRQARLDGTLP